jgi:4-oxalocrotonate tautomerase
MPHVIVKLFPGKTEEQKKNLAAEITKAIVNTLNKPESSVSIAMEEIPEKEWMKKVYDTEITPNLEKLYKKPGY